MSKRSASAAGLWLNVHSLVSAPGQLTQQLLILVHDARHQGHLVALHGIGRKTRCHGHGGGTSTDLEGL